MENKTSLWNRLKEKITRKNLLALLLITVALLIMPVLIYFVAITPGKRGFIRENDAGSWLGYYGAVFGGAITLIGVWWSIHKQEETRKEDQKKIDARRKEDQRMSVLPYFSYQNNYVKPEIYSTHIDNYDIRVCPAGIIPYHLATADYDYTLYIKVKNLGIGIAVFPSIRKILYCGEEKENSDESRISIGPGEEAFITFFFIYPENQIPTFSFTVGYYDMFNNYSVQNVSINFSDVGQNDFKKYYVYLGSVDKPQLINKS